MVTSIFERWHSVAKCSGFRKLMDLRNQERHIFRRHRAAFLKSRWSFSYGDHIRACVELEQIVVKSPCTI